ncbi:MAG: lyase family protein, partial [Sediminibacterium sp.]
MKLWQKNSTVSEAVEHFTVGKDREMDLLLAPFDVLGSIAHVTMLAEVGLLTKEEAILVNKELRNIYKEIQDSLHAGVHGTFTIHKNIEDIHSQIEFMLTERIGEAGKKIHSARSRNDQVLVDIKLFLRNEIRLLAEEVQNLFQLLQVQSEKFKAHLLPGYTHLQLAMPSSFGLWFGAYAESLVDDITTLQAAYKVVNKNPLGSAAGYGSSFPIN